MGKYPCGLIKDLLPLYIEGDVSSETKEIVEKHLGECKDCSALMSQFSNDEIKIDNLYEDFPQADTFKKWIRKLKMWGLITTVSAIFIAIVIGALGYKIGEKPKNDILTLKTIVKTFEKQGISLKEESSVSSDEYALNGVKPAVFSLDEKKGKLLVYTFKSFVERDDILNDTNKFNNTFSLQEYSFKAKNALVVYMASQIPTNEEEMKSIGDTITLISNIVFKDLNDGKGIVYKGQSESWKGTFTSNYYEHWWQDETGVLHHDSYYNAYPTIKYKKSDIESVGTIDFEYKTIGGGGSSSGATLNKDGIAELGRSGGSGGSGFIPREDDNINFTVRWNGREESMVLKAK